MQQMELESSALPLSHAWPALPHVRKRRPTLLLHVADTDVVVLAVASFNKIAPDELWVAFGAGSRFRYIAVHQMVAIMNPTQCLTLPVFQVPSLTDHHLTTVGRFVCLHDP